jgi:3-oxoacyl-[acyl-carrier protein] reductase
MLSNEVALVTGGSRGIGKEIAITLAKNNAKVAINYSNSELEALKVVDEIKLLGSKAIAVKADISQISQVEQMVEKVEKELGKPSILINNAGVTRDGLLMRMKEEDWDKVIDINLKGAYNCSKLCVKSMVKAKKGNIINVSSIVGIFGNAGQVNYAASKAGLIGFTKSLAKEVASRGIRVNCIAPGFIETEMTASLPEEMVHKLKSQISLGRLGTVQDVAQLVLFLVSPSASYITGEVIKIDGGLSL